MADFRDTQPAAVPDDGLIHAMAQCLDESVTMEGAIRALVDKAGFNDPDATVEECVAALVQSHLRLTVPS